MPRYPATKVPFINLPSTVATDVRQESLFVAAIDIQALEDGDPLPDEPLQHLYFHPDINHEGGALVSVAAADVLRPLPNEDGTRKMDRPLRRGDQFEVWVENIDGWRYRLVQTVKDLITSYPDDQAGFERTALDFFILASVDELEEEFQIQGKLDELNEQNSLVDRDTDELVLFAFKGGCIPPPGHEEPAAAEG